MNQIVTGLRVSLALAVALTIAQFAFAQFGIAAAAPGCTRSLAHYTDYAKQLTSIIDRVRRQADDNPLYESDAQYYAAELNDARQCISTLSPNLAER